MLRTTIVTALAIIAVADFASRTAFARDLGADVESVKVGFADLDLSAPQGARVMTVRIHNAARDICGGDETSYADLARRRLAQNCIEDTSTRAAITLGAPLVTAMIARAPDVVMASR